MGPNRFSISQESLRSLSLDIDKTMFDDLEPPIIMGILNVTPDSFSDGGSFSSMDEAVNRALEMVEEGADIIDIGGESTRPFADPVSIQEEIDRTIPVIRSLVDQVNVPLSIDTRHVQVAKLALESGASLVNDVNGLREPGMDELIVDTGSTAVIMHMKGTPKDMQISPNYGDVIEDIHGFLSERVDHMIGLGTSRDRLFIDPGIGFGKGVGDNLMILREMDRFSDIGCPILIGASRKSFIGKVLDSEVDDRLVGSIASAIIAAMNGASVLRVHDVKDTKRALKIFKGIIDPDRFL